MRLTTVPAALPGLFCEKPTSKGHRLQRSSPSADSSLRSIVFFSIAPSATQLPFALSQVIYVISPIIRTKCRVIPKTILMRQPFSFILATGQYAHDGVQVILSVKPIVDSVSVMLFLSEYRQRLRAFCLPIQRKISKYTSGVQHGNSSDESGPFCIACFSEWHITKRHCNACKSVVIALTGRNKVAPKTAISRRQSSGAGTLLGQSMEGQVSHQGQLPYVIIADRVFRLQSSWSFRTLSINVGNSLDDLRLSSNGKN